jgi:Flp pilus assembly protein TadD
MKRKFLSVFLLFCLAAIAAAETTSDPVDTTQLMAWLTAGISSKRIIRLVHERGLALAPTASEMQQFAAAGADKDLVSALAKQKPVTIHSARTSVPQTLLQAAKDARRDRYHEAEIQLRAALRLEPQNAALHFALAAMLRQQEQWDDAYDELKTSSKLMPDFPENHIGLAYVFYRVDDGPNAVAEARTALSMDPKNAEAYRNLGLALQSTEQYTAAAHAFSESLALDPDNPDTYYDLGIALEADGNMSAAEAAYRHASHLRTTSVVRHEKQDWASASTSMRASHVESPR